MKEILLSQGKISIVDDKDFARVNLFKWYFDSNGYAVRNRRKSEGRKTTIKLHRFLMGLDFGDKREVDHINGDTLDNQRYNLRICTHQQNSMNCKKQNGTSIYKGISFHKATGKWQATIMFNRKKVYIGLFSSEIEAAKTYNESAKKYLGEFARLNKIVEIL